jgi:hypothetical protein
MSLTYCNYDSSWRHGFSYSFNRLTSLRPQCFVFAQAIDLPSRT